MPESGSIGVFDSGFGGLSILKEVVAALPEYHYIYLGDNARTPYGTRSPEVVYRFTKEAVEFLFAKGCILIILACNTASAEALRRIQQEYAPKDSNRRILGVIVPAVEEAVTQTKNGKIGVLATESTITSGAFLRELRQRGEVEVFQQAAPLLVPFVEAGEQASPEAHMLLTRYLSPFKEKGIDTLILGCTHYGHLGKEIKSIVGEQVTVLSEGPIVAKKLQEYLQRHQEIASDLSRSPGVVCYSTDTSDRFSKLGAFFFGSPLSPLQVELE